MTTVEKIAFTKALIGADTSATDELISAYLSLAEEAIMQRRYPHGIPEGGIMPTQYELSQCRLASRYFFRRGAEGEISHNEDGVNRTYGSVNDEDILREVIQVVGVR